MPDRPVLAFALSPERTRNVFAPGDEERLAACCTIPQPTPIRHFADAASLMREVEVLVSGWGCPPIDSAVLAASLIC